MQKTRYGVTKQSYCNTSFYTNNWRFFSFKCASLKSGRKQKVQLQINVTIILAFITAHVFTFTEIFISPYGFELLSDVLSFLPGRRNLGHFLQGRSSGHRLPQLFLSGVLISLSLLKGSFARYKILGWLLFSFRTLNVLVHRSLGFQVSDEKSADNLTLGIPCMWWHTSFLMLSRFFVFWKFDYNVS